MLTIAELVRKIRRQLVGDEAFELTEEEAIRLIVDWATAFSVAVANDPGDDEE